MAQTPSASVPATTAGGLRRARLKGTLGGVALGVALVPLVCWAGAAVAGSVPLGSQGDWDALLAIAAMATTPLTVPAAVLLGLLAQALRPRGRRTPGWALAAAAYASATLSALVFAWVSVAVATTWD